MRTKKTIQHHFQCNCGYNSVSQEKTLHTHLELRKRFKRRKGFYLNVIKAEACNQCEPE